MKDIKFDRNFEPPFETAVALSPLLRRITCNNPGPFTFTGTNTFIVGHQSVAIIDPGPDDDAHLAAILNAVRGETVSHILVTHTHMDHSSLAAKLAAATGAATCSAILPVKSNVILEMQVDASVDHGFAPDVTLRDGDVVEGKGWALEAVFTPGHMSNHMSFSLASEKTLLAGDHVMAWATSVVAPPDGNMNDYMGSLRKLLIRDEAIYYPAHGPESRKPRALVRAILAHRMMREAAIFNRVKAGDGTIEEVVANIYADVDPRLHGAAGRSTLAHLEYLIDMGRIAVRKGRYYSRD
ncbi:MAG TPA: MBL fold metallo-hydrolase [Aestuariivirga sp.]|nr:MBL fold metallo-hydrolase [Aestuariivirga sp.]